MTRLRRREHDFEGQPGGYRECEVCGKVISPDEVALPLCPGPPEDRHKDWRRRSKPLSRRSRLKPVSDRRDEKRRTRAVRGPLCDDVRGVPCAVPGCNFESDPAHVRGVGAGFGDFIWSKELSRWLGNVVNLCRPHHRFLDGKVGGGGSPEAFEERFGIDVRVGGVAIGDRWMERKGIDATSPIHPYLQIQEESSGQGD